LPRQASYGIIRIEKGAPGAGPSRGDSSISADDNAAIRIYDTPLWKAVAFIADKIGEAKDTTYFPKTRALLEERAIAGELCLWGRKQLDADPKWVETRKFANRHTPIPSEYWATSKLAPYCVVEPVIEDRDHNLQAVLGVPCTQEADKGTWTKERNSYADLQVNWKQIMGLGDTSRAQNCASSAQASALNAADETVSVVAPKFWHEIEIAFLSDERVEICCRATERKTYNYGELGFEDRRNGKPNRAWTMLREMAKKNGTIQRPSPGENRAVIQKRIEEIREKLRGHFENIGGDPIPFNGNTYQASFKISCRESFET
jgi:hypothetical protein